MSSTVGSTPALFSPVQVGDIKLAHRVVLAPLTRLRNTEAHVPTDLGVEYYKQRASVPGTLLISEATFIAPEASGQPNTPGIWNEAQIAAWKKVVEAVHAKGSHIYLQLWALGRTARPAVLHKEFPDVAHTAPSPIALGTQPDAVPRELTKDEIKQFVQWYGKAAKNAVEGAGFDGVEVHGAAGYLVDQFLQDVSNKRTDEYGGSIENRARFVLEVMDAVVKAVGETKVALRMSPWSMFHDMGMADPIPQFSYLVEQLKQRHPNLAYLHVISPGLMGSKDLQDESQVYFVNKLWAPGPVITNAGYDRESGMKVAEETGQLVSYGVKFLANPDLPFRLRENLSLNEADVSTFYTPLSAKGYTDYQMSEEFLKSQAQT